MMTNKSRSYNSKAKKQSSQHKHLQSINTKHKKCINLYTQQAMIDAKEGNTIKCDNFEDYLKHLKWLQLSLRPAWVRFPYRTRRSG